MIVILMNGSKLLLQKFYNVGLRLAREVGKLKASAQEMD